MCLNNSDVECVRLNTLVATQNGETPETDNPVGNCLQYNMVNLILGVLYGTAILQRVICQGNAFSLCPRF